MENKKVLAEQYEFPFVKNEELMMAGMALCEICNKRIKKRKDKSFNVCSNFDCQRAAAKFL